MVIPSPQIAIGLLLISIGIVVTFDIKIDFIIWPSNPNETIYLDCKSINGPGTAIERTPHTVYKYHHQYHAKEIYILEGKLNNPAVIREHCNSICTTHFIKLDDLELILTKQKRTSQHKQCWGM